MGMLRFKWVNQGLMGPLGARLSQIEAEMGILGAQMGQFGTQLSQIRYK